MNRQRDDVTIRHQVQIALLVLVHLIEDAPQLILQVDAIKVRGVLLPGSLRCSRQLKPACHAERREDRADNATVDRVSVTIIVRQFKQCLDILLLISQDRAVIVVDQFTVIGDVLVVVYGDTGRRFSPGTNKVLRGTKLVCRTLFSGGCSLIRGILPLRPPGRVRSPLLFAVYIFVREIERLETYQCYTPTSVSFTLTNYACERII